MELWSTVREALTAANVPFEPPKEASFSDTDEGRLCLAICRIVCSKDPDVIAHRIVMGLKRGVGVKSCKSIKEKVLSAPGLTFVDLFYNQIPSGWLTPRESSAINAARETCERIAEWSCADLVADRAEEIADIIEGTLGEAIGDEWRKYVAELHAEMTLKELRDFLWAATDAERVVVVKAIFDRVGEEAPENAGFTPRIPIMTMHGAKGLSARVVFIPALEEGVMPRDDATPAVVFESARLLYVSITRARAACILSHAFNRRVFGKWTQLQSRFASQTGGAFAARSAGLTAAEVDAIVSSIADL
jgi:DNA helicase-2/ATP-dependent DNA helicase PcrA